MTSLAVEEFIQDNCEVDDYTLSDYESEAPRWCKGCGDHAVLSSLQRILRDLQEPPEKIVSVSGIGCSSRLPHYLKTYGFHGIHGRALPISLGVTLARPDLKVLTIMGDGDCFSIGGGHWLHTLRYNPDMTVLVLDNNVYALTKKQVSPTSPMGAITNTTPRGSYLESLNPLSVIMSITNVSFLAQTATWLPVHMEDVLHKAWKHKGLSFVRILQRCPIFMPNFFTLGGEQSSMMFLENSDEGVVVSKGIHKKAPVVEHDHRDIHAAQRLVMQTDPAPLGLIYWNPDIPTYGDIRSSRIDKMGDKELVEKLTRHLDKFAVHQDH